VLPPPETVKVTLVSVPPLLSFTRQSLQADELLPFFTPLVDCSSVIVLRRVSVAVLMVGAVPTFDQTHAWISMVVCAVTVQLSVLVNDDELPVADPLADCKTGTEALVEMTHRIKKQSIFLMA
jgi:hypothetical protein